MDTIDDISKSINSFVKPIFEDKVGAAVLSLVIVLYAGLAAPKLPHAIAKLFANKIFKLLVLVFVAYTASKNTSIAIISAVALVISMQTLSKFEKGEEVIKELEKEVNDDESVEEPVEETSEIKIVSEENKVESVTEEPVSEEKIEAAGPSDSGFATYKPESIESEEPLNTTEENKLLVTQAKKEIESELKDDLEEVTESEEKVTESEVEGTLETPQTDLNAPVIEDSDAVESEPVEVDSVEEPKKVEEPKEKKTVKDVVTGYEPETYAPY